MRKLKLFDIVFLVSTLRLLAHRNILASASPYFEKMLYGGMKESTQKEVVLKQCGVQTWRALFNFIHGDEIKFSASKKTELFKFLYCAKYCQLEGLKQLQGSLHVCTYQTAVYFHGCEKVWKSRPGKEGVNLFG